MEFKRANLLIISILILIQLSLVSSIKTVKSFEQLAEHHCETFPIEDLWRIASGTISQKYGDKYFDFDCYIRQFVRKDGLVIEESIESQEDQDDQQQQQDNNDQKQLTRDPIVVQYSLGLKKCLPSSANPQEATYLIWRFFRYLVQHDYVYQWMRAKVRATLGYEAQRPNSWMDGQNSAARLRLDKLFSNQFYEYVDTLMFKDFLFPLLTFFKENTVIAIGSKAAQGGKPLLYQSISTKNILPKIFEPVILNLQDEQPIFSYTIPGIPLLLGGSTQSVSWSFTGILVDRSNIQEIQTVGNKFYHHDTEQWLKLNTQQIAIPGVEEKVCKFMHSAYGPLYTKLDRQGKNQEYIMRWHEKQSKVRQIFSGLLDLIKNNGNLPSQSTLQFPFNSIVLVNQTGIYQYVCQQFYPSYFLYPDMFGEPQKINQRWFSYPTKKIVVVSNSHMTTTKQQSYDKGQPLSPMDQQILAQFKSKSNFKFTTDSLIQFAQSIQTTSQLKKQKQIMVRIYRKVKFLYIPDEVHRKKCDQLISMLEKWNNNLDDKKLAPIYILWNYFLRQYTFNYVSASQFGGYIAKHRVITDNYWVGQMTLWEKGTSYGQCDSYEYDQMKHEVNGTGHNSSCYLNIIRAFNKTKDILSEKYNGDFSKINLDDFVQKKYFSSSEQNFKGNHIEQAFGVYYSQNVKFASQIGNPHVTYFEGYQNKRQYINLNKIDGKKQDEEQL